MTPLRDRSTSDLVVIFLTAMVGVIMILTLIAVIVVAVVNPEQDVTATFRFIANLTNTIVGGVIGYVAGRNVKSANGGY